MTKSTILMMQSHFNFHPISTMSRDVRSTLRWGFYLDYGSSNYLYYIGGSLI